MNQGTHSDYVPGQLTRFSVGSVRELWTLAYPLMLSMFSVGAALFADSLFLAHLSVDAFTAVAEASMFFMAIAFSFDTFVSISEVLVGRLFGEENYKKLAQPIWTMVFVSMASCVVFIPLGLKAGTLFFHDMPNSSLASTFFSTLCFFGPFPPINVALSSFWVGRGKTTKIALAVAFSSVLNILLDSILIFGMGPIPPLGVKGAALATGCSQLALTIVLISSILQKRNRESFHTHKICFSIPFLKQAFSLGFPQALAMLVQGSAWAVFFRIMSLAGTEHVLVCSISQSIFLFFNFIIEGTSKAASSIVANLIGSGREREIPHVVLAGLRLIALFGGLVAIALLSRPEEFLHLFLNSSNYDPISERPSAAALFWIWLTLLGEAILFLGANILVAFGHSRFVLFTSSCLIWLLAIIPAYVVTLHLQYSPDVAFAILCGYYLVTCFAYFQRIFKLVAIRRDDYRVLT